jgi:asparagine synthase (glutamine-hydrolysing)
LSWFPWQEDERSTADYLRYGYYLPGTTAYHKVREVLPGHWLRWQVGRVPVQKPYWSLSVDAFLPSVDQARSLLKDAVIASVKRRMVADVEVGALLSGGIDSSLVTGIIRQELKQPLKTFTMGFAEPTFDERSYARRIARRFNSEHFEGCLRIEGWEELESLVLDQVGQPFADGSLLPAALISQMASEHVKVVLSGDGGDELFSGYQRYLARCLLRWYTRLPHGLRRCGEQLLGVFPEPGVHHSASFLKMAHLFVDVSARMEEERACAYVAPLNYTQDDLARLVPDLWRIGHQPPGLPLKACKDDIFQMMVADALIYLPQDILTKVDRASMAFSLEVRSPFMDRRVVELAFAMPRHWHRRGLRGKRMLQDCFSELMPEWVWKRRKHGFGVPVHQWFHSGLEGRLRMVLNEASHPLQNQFVETLITDHLNGRRDHGQRLWQIYIYLLWRMKKLWRTS